MVAMKNIVLFISAVSAIAIPKRTLTTILADLNTIETDLESLTDGLNTYTGGLLQSATVEAKEIALNDAIVDAGTDTIFTPVLSTDDSKAVYTAAGNMVPLIQESLNAVVAKEATFAAAGLTSTVRGNIGDLQKSTDALYQQISKIVSPDLQQSIIALGVNLDSSFNVTLAALTS
ncbi:hypothetical protein DSL72_009424 [Monilinia vaccinii-corymbosi]|uniref:Hydrophobic surface binding protein n=1 Tax=Monilinia vaccinii-corymbosi TaxID=61207 RepID=A0A8A3PRB2_9HELO|nr:hypothetical protein DSL72_009424 [Monilinia vaccinii-corymbosi]